MDKRYVDDKGNDCLISVDTVDHEILEPWPYVKSWSKQCFPTNLKGLA